MAKSKRPMPLVLYIHSGGFIGGDKDSLSPELLIEYLDSGIALKERLDELGVECIVLYENQEGAVNLTSKLGEDIAFPAEILVTMEAYEQIPKDAKSRPYPRAFHLRHRLASIRCRIPTATGRAILRRYQGFWATLKRVMS